jgi:diguanylate cyclase (GGDEF)-like protein
MDRDISTELRQLKREYVELEKCHQDEKQSLLNVIATFGNVVAAQDNMAGEVESIKGLLDGDGAIPSDRIENEIRALKAKIVAGGGEDETVGESLEQIRQMEDRLLVACRMIRSIMVALFNDFYPMNAELESKANAININCKKAPHIDFKTPTADFLGFVEGLKAKIGEDFRYINETFFMLLDHVKGLEKTLTSEFGKKERLEEIERFELKVSTEVGSIVDSFNVHRTVSEIKEAVVEKIKNIKRLVSLRKKEELNRARRARQNIKNLQKRISEVEKDAREMSRKAEEFQAVAKKDGLTGLYNRNAFDLKVTEGLKTLNESEKSFSVVVFDVDKFKSINDTFGHVAGDKVLKQVSACLRETFRKDDFIARYGGDEFAVVIERLTEEMAHERIMAFQKLLSKKRFTSYRKGDIALTVSAGIAMAQEGDTPEALIHRADQAMYAAKQESRRD